MRILSGAASALREVQPRDLVRCAMCGLFGLLVYHMVAGTQPPPPQAAGTSGKGTRRRGQLPPGRVLFVPTLQWQPVLDEHVLPAGLHIRINITTGVKEARAQP
jgi:hypothetical protein